MLVSLSFLDLAVTQEIGPFQMPSHSKIIYLTWSGPLPEFYFASTKEARYAVSTYRRHRRKLSFRCYFSRSLRILIFGDLWCCWENLKNCSFQALGKCCRTNLYFCYSVMKTLFLHVYGQYLTFLHHST